jgi:hypothetical protein
MSADEINEQNAWLGIDLEAAKKHLAHLREKAFRDSPESLPRNTEHQSNAVESITDDYFDSLDRDKTRALADELGQASRLVLDLETRLRRFHT